MKFIPCIRHYLDLTRHADFLAPLLLRLYLVPVFWMAGSNKWSDMESTAAWFGNPDWGLGLPFPTLLAYLATLTEIIGAIALLLGLGVRLISIPLMIVMLVAAVSVHLQNGWLAIAESGSEASERLSGFMGWLSNEYPGRHEYITELGSPVMLNNGIEFATTYFVMLLVLFFVGSGRYVSLDYWLAARDGGGRAESGTEADKKIDK